MTRPPFSRAVVCLARVIRGMAIAAAPIVACGGNLSTPVDGGADGSSPATHCPSNAEIDANSALGQACAAPEGTYCFNPTCDACNKSCPAVSCTNGTWKQAVNTAICTGQPDAGGSVDAGADADANVCITLDPSTYDHACTQDPDCMTVTGGTFCGNGPWCMCPAETINVDGKSRYDAELQNIESHLKPGPGGCTCPFFGTARCVVGKCTLCGGAAGTPPGCPDAG